MRRGRTRSPLSPGDKLRPRLVRSRQKLESVRANAETAKVRHLALN